MEIKVLGSAGGEAPGNTLTGFRIDGDLLVDAGTVGTQLSLPEQRAIRHVLLTHAHLDHVHALPFLLDNLIGRISEPVTVYGLAETLDTVRRHIFNGALWPDFSILPTPDNPVVRWQAVRPSQPFTAGACRVEAVATHHSVPSVAYLVSQDGRGSVAFSGDTGPTEALWQRLAACRDLKALFVECSYPRSQQAMAERTRHLGLANLILELDKMGKPEIPAYLYHMKPEYANEIEKEAAEVSRRLVVAKPGDSYRW